MLGLTSVLQTSWLAFIFIVLMKSKVAFVLEKVKGKLIYRTKVEQMFETWTKCFSLLLLHPSLLVLKDISIKLQYVMYFTGIIYYVKTFQ
jgi:hypothetical protein